MPSVHIRSPPPLSVELVAGPYEPGPDEVVWLLTTENATPESVPDGTEVSAVRDPNELPTYQLRDQFGYPTDPILRVSPPNDATTPEEAIAADSYVEFELTPPGRTRGGL